MQIANAAWFHMQIEEARVKVSARPGPDRQEPYSTNRILHCNSHIGIVDQALFRAVAIAIAGLLSASFQPVR
jgi:hypothetical protein